ncbi:uncharacterized protein, partial [Cherax quadricarinatus]|uniref:uncharacterized protein n=1 Tax=Cherax quadricarinatus TaxID=27406 RepID=UPI00387E6249
MFTQTLNALNPVPYLLGGLNGVRQVMQQRLQPLQGIIMRNAPRPSNFRGSPNFFNSGGGGFSSSGGGERHAIGGGSRYAGNGMDVVAAGPKHIESVDERLTRGTHNQFHPSDSTAEAFKSVFQSTRRPLTDSNSDPLQTVNFGPPKPISVMGDGSPAPHLSTGNPHTLSQPYSEAISGPNDSSTPDVVHELKPQNKYTRIINIHVPEEMQNLTILEINMKANGDISIGGSSGKNTSSPPANLPTSHISSPLPPALISSPPSPLLSPLSSSAPIDHLEIFYPQYPPFPPGVGDIFSEDQRLHELAFDTNPEDFEVHTNPEGLSFDGTNSQDLTPARPMSVNSHDIFRMQPLVNTNTALRYNLPVEWRSLNNLQPNLENDHIDANNEHIPVELPVSLLRNKHVPKFSRQFPPEKSNPNQIYFVPVNMPSATSESLPPVQNRPLFARQNRPTSDIHSRPSFSIQNRPVSDIQSRPSFASQSQRSQPDSQGSPMYYIDITI